MHSRLALLVLLAGCLRSACENKKEVTFGAFVTHHWVEVLEPRNGARVQGVLVVKASVRRGSLGVLDDGFVTHLPFIVDSSQKWFDVPANESVYVTEARLRNFCDELGLGGDNCEHALASVQQLTEQRALWANGLSRNESACVVVTERARGEIAVCTELYRKCGIELYRKCGISEAALRAGVSLQTKGWTGTYDVSVEPRGFAGTQAPRNSPQAAASSVSVDVVASDCGVGDVRIVEPRKGALTPPTFVARAEGPAAACFVLDGGNARCEMCLGATGAPGRRNCEVSYDGVGPGRHRLAVFEAGGRCEARVDFEVGPASWAARTALAAAIGRPALITAASERYVTQRILENLVGSLHHWEPHRPLDVYDVGLSEAAVNLVSTWRNVNVLSVQSALDNVLSRTAVEAAKHVLNSSTYAFKALVILDALRRHGTAVLWLDANAELRRPLARIDAMIAECECSQSASFDASISAVEMRTTRACRARGGGRTSRRDGVVQFPFVDLPSPRSAARRRRCPASTARRRSSASPREGGSPGSCCQSS
mmetsp:Transcript_5302/g.18806  ORF Transcript_5302/g.18806 Transcript_5302/m.18806 type:complete len:540 (+) Transcript_5302:108-1727(+)